MQGQTNQRQRGTTGADWLLTLGPRGTPPGQLERQLLTEGTDSWQVCPVSHGSVTTPPNPSGMEDPCCAHRPRGGDSGRAGAWEGCSSQWSASHCLQVPHRSTDDCVALGSSSWRAAFVPESHGATWHLADLAVDFPEMSVHLREQAGRWIIGSLLEQLTQKFTCL